MLPAGVELQTNTGPALALSRDGRRMAFIGLRDGLRQVYTRLLDQVEAAALSGTEYAVSCGISPERLGFHQRAGRFVCWTNSTSSAEKA